MNLSFPQLLAGSVGALLIYCAIVNKTPVQVIQDAMNNTKSTAVPAPSPQGGTATSTTAQRNALYGGSATGTSYSGGN